MFWYFNAKKTMKIISTFLLGFGVAVIAFTSCKKQDDPPAKSSLSSYIQGTWKATFRATDDNANGVMDASEKVVDSADLGNTFTFNPNSTFVIKQTGVTVGEEIWTLTNNNTYLKLMDTAAGGVPEFLHIDFLSSSAMTLRDTIGGTAQWIVLEKL